MATRVRNRRRVVELPADDGPRWPDADVRMLTLMVLSGMSYARMAKKLGRTRNQVIGKVHRLGVRKPATPERVASDNAVMGRIVSFRRRAMAGAVVDETGPEVWAPPVVVAFEELGDNACRWPIGDPKSPGFGFCGCPKSGSSYCAEHARIAYDAKEPEDVVDVFSNHILPTVDDLKRAA